MTGITWLHLSDWHQKGEDFDREVVRDQLIEDIKNREKNISPDLAKIDFIIFSGDVAFSGKKEEYEAAQKYLFDPVLEATELPANRLFIVPGNHDLDRYVVDELLPCSMQKPFESKDQDNNDQSKIQVKDWLTDNRKRDRLLEPFEAYREFVTKYTGHLSPDYSCVQTIRINGKRVALLGLNSALMAGRKNETGAVNDEGKLIVGEFQLYNALNRIASCDVRIAVMHHPLELLAKFERHLITQRIQDNENGCHFLLCGHLHESEAYQLIGTTGDCVIIPAGSSYSNRDYHNGYNFVHLNLEESNKGTGTVYLRCWDYDDNYWDKDIGKSHKNGYITFELPRKNIALTPIRPEPYKSSKAKAELKNHFDTLVPKIRNGSVVPFLGADINLCDRPENPEQIPFPSTWDINNEFPPTSVELAAYLDQREKGEYLQTVHCPLCDTDTLPRGCPIRTLFVTRLDLQNVSQYLSTQDEKNIQETITEIAKLHKYKPNNLHKFLANLPHRMDDMGYSAQIKNVLGGDPTRYQLIVTTNFDSTLESAFMNAKQPFDLVSYTVDNQVKQFVHQKFELEKKDTELTVVNKGETKIPPGAADKYPYNFLQERPVILKLYGSVNWPEHPIKSFAITEDNFIDYLAYADSNPQNLLPPSLLNKLKNSHIWFLGYSLRYWHQRVILRRLLPMKAQRVKETWYVVHPKLDVLDDFLWEANDVHCIIETSLENYIEELTKRLKEPCDE